MASKFLKVRCGDCSNEQVVFDHAATTVPCQMCGTTLVEPRSGEAVVKAEIVSTLE